MLLQGATREQLDAGSRGAIDEHIRHLEVEHGLAVSKTGGVYKLVGVSGTTSR